MQYLQTISLGTNALVLKYKINKTENKIIANIICETAKSEQDHGQTTIEEQEDEIDKVIKHFQQGIHTNTLSIKDKMTKAINFFQHEAKKINRNITISFQTNPRNDELIGEDSKNAKIKSFNLTIHLKKHTKNCDHAKITNLQEEITTSEDRLEQIEAELKKGIDTKYHSDEHFTTKMHQKDVIKELEKIVHAKDLQASIQIENATKANSILKEGNIIIETVIRLDHLKKVLWYKF